MSLCLLGEEEEATHDSPAISEDHREWKREGLKIRRVVWSVSGKVAKVATVAVANIATVKTDKTPFWQFWQFYPRHKYEKTFKFSFA
jgi:hypothetical protein